MTKNQIEFQKLKETMRANRESEAITTARDLASKRLGLETLQETARHNQQVELQARDNLAEQYRNNVAQLAELQRAHLESEGIARRNADTERERSGEAIRHNATTEKEAARHNRVVEEISQINADINRLGVELGAESRLDAASISAAASRAAAAMAAGASQYASDNALLAKQLQLDLDKYNIDLTQELKRDELDERQRAAMVQEKEQNRANQALEAIREAANAEIYRHNVAMENQGQQKIDTDVQLRGEQNRIAAQQANIAQQKVNIDLSLMPSQSFSNTARGIESITSPLIKGIELFTKKGK